MITLGVDPSLSNFGWAVYDTLSGPLAHGRLQTSAKTLYIDRYIDQRQSLIKLIEEYKPDAVGLEFPVFGAMYSEGMYGLFLFVSEALRTKKQDVVFLSPGQIKAHARFHLQRPPKWKMEKPDMVEAAKVCLTKGQRWNHNEADALWAAFTAARFWGYFKGEIPESELNEVERDQFIRSKIHKRTMEETKTGILYREDERFFRWSETEKE